MHTFVAFAFDRVDSFDQRATAALRRVEQHYAPIWSDSSRRNTAFSARLGVCVWEEENTGAMWPNWAGENGRYVATPYDPVGRPDLLSTSALSQNASIRLAETLEVMPFEVRNLTPPFVLVSLDTKSRRLEIFNDRMGLGRLFHAKNEDISVWSNRPVAACLFVGLHPVADERGWGFAAGSWFMDDTSPLEGVYAVPAGTHILIAEDGATRRRSFLDSAFEWASRSPELRNSEKAAESLITTAKSIARLSNRPPTIDLSGGRDSRLVAAAFLAAGVEVTLRTHNLVPGEVETARRLVQSYPSGLDHQILNAEDRQKAVWPETEVISKVRNWHAIAEGLRPASYAPALPPARLLERGGLNVGGAGGEIAHGHYYPRDILEVDQLPAETRPSAYAERLLQRVVIPIGVSELCRQQTHQHILSLIVRGVNSGFNDAGVLDYFYVDERLRRWSSAGERNGIASPLLSPAFVDTAFQLTPYQKSENLLHSEVIKQLVPAWGEIPFFKARAGDPNNRPAQVLRLASAPDAELIAHILWNESSWATGFDGETVRALWLKSIATETTATEEDTLRRVLWRAVFDDFVAELALTEQPMRERFRIAASPIAHDQMQDAESSSEREYAVQPRNVPQPMVRWARQSPIWRAIRKTRIGTAISKWYAG